MSKTTLSLNQNYFTSEVTKAFLIDFENACMTMELSAFADLFKNYNLEFIEDYREVFDMIAHIMTSWKNPGQVSTLLEVTCSDSKCIFCYIGKAVKVYKWTYRHLNAEPPMNRVVYETQVGFYFGYNKNQLREFGVCNAYIK
ncbi:MAG: hypothetical protein EOO51_01455 [Flavobacterium sp.]|nr:MAG: hypothetical protein EOO51_01455 [Flavobacterium sp.]